MSNIPQNIPEGAIRYNTDSNNMEVWIGQKWMIVSKSSPNLEGGARGLFGGGGYPNVQNVIDYVTTASAGDAQDFGDLTSGRGFLAAGSNSTKIAFAGGNTGSNSCLLYTSPSPRDRQKSRMPSSA